MLVALLICYALLLALIISILLFVFLKTTDELRAAKATIERMRTASQVPTKDIVDDGLINDKLLQELELNGLAGKDPLVDPAAEPDRPYESKSERLRRQYDRAQCWGAPEPHVPAERSKYPAIPEFQQRFE